MIIDNDNDIEEIEEIIIGDYKFNIISPENDFNSNKKTLFATIIWSGSYVLSNYLIKNKDVIKNKSCIEFGAAIGLPSLVCSKLEADFICSTDYPSDCVIQTLNNNINNNYNNEKKNVVCLPHIWGEEVLSLLQPLQSYCNDANAKYDVAISCECLWKHENHLSLVNSIISTLKVKGFLYLTYSHHMPGKEDKDNNFITLLLERNFSVVYNEIIVGYDQWDKNKQKDVYLFVLQRDL